MNNCNYHYPVKKKTKPSKRPPLDVLDKMYSCMSAREIGEVLGVPKRTVESWIYLARKEMQRNE